MTVDRVEALAYTHILDVSAPSVFADGAMWALEQLARECDNPDRCTCQCGERARALLPPPRYCRGCQNHHRPPMCPGGEE